jgi:hypothetical protein
LECNHHPNSKCQFGAFFPLGNNFTGAISNIKIPLLQVASFFLSLFSSFVVVVVVVAAAVIVDV